MSIFSRIQEIKQRNQRVKAEKIKARNLYNDVYIKEKVKKIKADTIAKAKEDALRPIAKQIIKNKIIETNKKIITNMKENKKVQQKKDTYSNINPLFHNTNNNNHFTGNLGDSPFIKKKNDKNFWE
jgi:hypothetical protein